MPKKKINRAGLIPYLKEGDEILMLFMKPSKPKYGGDVFQIAKGKQEPEEKIKDTAIREAQEELGLFTGNVTEVTRIGEFLGRTTIFIAEVEDRDAFGDPHFETSETKWMTLEEFLKEGRDLHRPVVKAAYRKIEKLLGE